jgi:O-antigen/teichoic acid export membrane protein
MSLKNNIIANYLGQSWNALINLAFVPVYVNYLGVEAYGLIGLYAALQAWLSLLDMGMTPTMNREVARLSAAVGPREGIHDLMYTFEIICAALALFIGFSLAAVSDWLANHWLNIGTLSNVIVSDALKIMALVAALRFFEGPYRGAILGLQMHVWFNVAVAILATLRALGAAIVVVWVESSIEAFFWWQALVSFSSVIVFKLGAHRYLPIASPRAAFSLSALSSTWRFSGGLFATMFLALAITQADKIILSRLLTLEAFGTYTFAAAVAGALFQLINPVAQSYYPKMTELVTSGDGSALSVTYHQGAQLMTVMLTPAGFLLIAFGEIILYIWTGNAVLAKEASLIVAILSVGTILNGWMHMPYMLQLAFGWSTFAVWTNLLSALVLVPAIFWVAPRYGAVGAAGVWVSVNAGYILVAVHFMHRRLLPGEKIKWYLVDIAAPTLSAGTVISCFRILQPTTLGQIGEVAWVIGAGGFAYAAAIFGAREYRKRLLAVLFNV